MSIRVDKRDEHDLAGNGDRLSNKRHALRLERRPGRGGVGYGEVQDGALDVRLGDFIETNFHAWGVR
jgi:hypothetical protein